MHPGRSQNADGDAPIELTVSPREAHTGSLNAPRMHTGGPKRHEYAYRRPTGSPQEAHRGPRMPTGGTTRHETAYRRHPGSPQEAHKRPPGGPQEAPRKAPMGMKTRTGRT